MTTRILDRETALSAQAAADLRTLCLEIPSRSVGSPGNRAATDLFAARVAACGWETESPAFDCLDWTQDGVQLTVGGTAFTAYASPYSLGCRVRAPLAVAATLAELEAAHVAEWLLLLCGELTREQLMPKSFPFYNPEHHQRLIGLLETKRPRAILAATARDVAMVGSQYPFPLIEDGDFDIPSVYMTDVEGARLAAHAGQVVALESRAQRIPAQGCNVIARKGTHVGQRVVLMAHIDARLGSPGAGDNASGVVALLLLAELLADYGGRLGIELVAMNGEDYYSSPGEQQYLARNAGRFGEIRLGVNLDDVGYHKGRIAYSLYGCPTELAALIREVFAAHAGLMEGEPWYQGDHGLFLLHERPTLALTAELVGELMAEITHTPRDTPDKVDPARLVLVARALEELVRRVAGQVAGG